MAESHIDINADLGEIPERIEDGSDRELMRYISSANVASGGHAGDEWSMRLTLEAAKELGIAVGAHPGYPDRRNFGRISMQLSPEEIEVTVREQIEALAAIAEGVGVRLVHVKPHGALYHDARRREVATAIGRAVIATDPQLIVVGQAGTCALEVWRDMGLRCAAEAFADRAYESDGSLRSRKVPGALLEEPGKAAQQAIDIVLRQQVKTFDGGEVAVSAQTLCLHSDTPGSAAMAREVSHQLRARGVVVCALSL